MTVLVRLSLVAAALAMGAAGACAGSESSKGAPSAASAPPVPFPVSSKTPRLPLQCLKTPERLSTPEWFPQDLPIPKGSFVSDIPPAQGGLRRVVVTAKASLSDFGSYVTVAWPKLGWTIGVGESEMGEIENTFLMKDRYGTFRATAAYCNKSLTLVHLTINDPSLKPQQTSL